MTYQERLNKARKKIVKRVGSRFCTKEEEELADLCQELIDELKAYGLIVDGEEDPERHNTELVRLRKRDEVVEEFRKWIAEETLYGTVEPMREFEKRLAALDEQKEK